MRISSLADLAETSRYLARIGAEPRSLRTAVVKQVSGSYWNDIAIIKFAKNGEVTAPDDYAPNDEEKKKLLREFESIEWPQVQKVKRVENLPEAIREADKDDVFWFRDTEGNILMAQVRKKKRDGGKAYIPYTLWDDGEWRSSEPDGLLPLFGLETIGDNSTVFIHEGAKAARAMQRMVSKETAEDAENLANHPWAVELSGAAHLGWTGGALSPHRTDWGIIRSMGVTRAYIVSDNDTPGVSAVPAISEKLSMVTFHVQFTHEWPVSFDLADDFPARMFRELDGKRRYVGPTFRSCLHPATWATDLIQVGRGKPTPVLRDHFKNAWSYIEEADVFVCIEMPEILRSEQILNKMLASFSHTHETAKLIVKAYTGRATRLCYKPNNPGRIVTDRTTSAINIHTPTTEKAEKGDPSPFLDFMAYMFRDEKERHEMLRWVATLVARPEIRMHYGVLLVSESQGIGKGTLGSGILSPLVGVQNVSWPSETEVVNSDFNDWMAHKRLIVVNEIYSGHSWKAYNKLKSLITDMEIQVNQKYMRRYVIENWAHILACSNSKRALKIEGDDRRWFYPTMTEIVWPRAKFVAFREWLESGGLGIIKTWAQGFGDYVIAGERAPMTSAKQELISESRSEAQQEAFEIATALVELGKPAALTMKGISSYVKNTIQGKIFDTDYELRKAMVDAGAVVFGRLLKIAGRMQYVVINSELLVLSEGLPDVDAASIIRDHLIPVGEILPELV